MDLNQVTLPTTDVAASVAFYQGMGFTLVVSSPHYARFECPEGGATFSVHLHPEAAATHGVVVYFECADLDARVASLEASGYVFDSPPTDQPWLWREARLRDPAGNALCLYLAGENRRDPPWRVGGRRSP